MLSRWSRRWRARRASAGRRAELRLGPVEYLLVTLIALGVAITIAMALVDPAG
jgi:hypothetical protein